MPYNELIKSFGGIRRYMREFYVYGFRSRVQYTDKSARSYDNERRRVESWLSGYMRFGRSSDGKNIFISIDSRVSRHNPLYNAWKAKSFTDGDITLHFILFDILHSPEVSLTLSELSGLIDGYTGLFDEPREFDASTLRKKLKEYIDEGIVTAEKRGRTLYYSRARDPEGFVSPSPALDNALDFFSEVAPCGVVGSYLLDKRGVHDERFSFKHHYMTGALDSEIVCGLLCAMREKRFVVLDTVNRQTGLGSSRAVVPLRLMISARSGRQHLMAYDPRSGRISAFRISHIDSVKAGGVCEDFDRLRAMLDRIKDNIWGVSTHSRSGERMEHIEFTVRWEPWEYYIPQRLEREKRRGTVEQIGEGLSRFSADVYDSSELIPWIRTFIGRLTEVRFSNELLQKQFEDDLSALYSYYGVAPREGGGDK